MATRSKTVSIQMKAAQLALAAPQVVAHRVARMALAGRTLTPRDKKEFTGMVQEKKQAFGQAWAAMAAETMRANQTLVIQATRLAWSPLSWGKPATGRRLANQSGAAALGIFGKGLAPIHKKAVANAKRLAGTRLR